MELKNNQGIAFANQKTKDSQPDFKGELNIEGKVWQIALWKKTSKNNNSYLSLQVGMKGVAEDKSKTTSAVLDDDIPWN